MKSWALWTTSHSWSGSVKGLKAPERKWWSIGLLQSNFLLSPARNLKSAPRPGACGPLPEGRGWKTDVGCACGWGKVGSLNLPTGVRGLGAAEGSYGQGWTTRIAGL